MYKNTLVLFLSILLFYSCNKTEKKPIKNTVAINDTLSKKDTSTVVQTTEKDVYFDYSNTVIKEEFKDSLSAKFSDLSTEDKFIITVPKGNINETISVFQIFNSIGELIYEKSFQTRYIANGYHLIYIKNDEEMEKYILTSAKEMVDPDSFTDISDKNEIGKDDVLGQSKDEFMNYDAFIECQNDKRPLFSISLAEEDTTYIGYSKKLKKAVDIIGCC
ncbi:hypothetical protein [Flavobacterium sp. Root186]|uniref:hypothetical protein n=1 Tax=Flavobacterium sp. Root186 TaxID=1736485 RepID=UPI0006FDEC1D|nr:hypothetical protein [Flavobacterium sp. Root186]KRB55605.1 hypothetical protein ASD98_13140 [Flavobacterium sp. Root186]